MDDYRFRTQQSPRNEAPMNSLVSPQRNGRPMPPQPVSQDPRTTLPRRFTTDSGRVPTLSTISTSQRMPEPQEYSAYKVQLLEKKKIEYEKLREQKRRFEAEMHKLDQQQRRDEFDIAQMQEDLGRGNGLGLTGHQSEPTTPPEYRETSSGFPTMFSRPNRYSTPSLGLVSPPGLFNRPGRSGSQLTSPQSGILQSRFFDDAIPSRSVPGSRRNSDEDEKEEALRQDPTSHRSTNALNRYSMPVTRRGNLYDNIDQTNTTGFLFRDDESSMDLNNFSNISNIDASEDGFPQLYAQKGNPNVLSASSAAVDLASHRASGEATPTNGWANIPRHRQQQSLSTLGSAQMNTTDGMSTGQAGSSTDSTSVASRPFRHSLDVSQYRETSTDTATTSTMPPSSTQVLSTPPKLQTSFSAGEMAAVKNVPSAALTPSSNANAHAQQHFHNHNASIGRIPPGAMKRHSRELSNDNHAVAAQAGAPYPSISSQLQGGAPAFGPVASSQAAIQAPISAGTGTAAAGSPSSLGPYQQFYGGYSQPNPNGPGPGPGPGYNMNMMTMGMQNLGMNNYPPQNYVGYGPMYQPHAQPRDSQQRVMQQRRAQDNEAMTRYANLSLEQVGGTIYDLCKDQHGCRYLQKQLENRNPEQVHMIWLETNQHVVELMTDPFGNYLCQKLLEYCDDDERTVLIQNASGEMVRIALNQHGTRALQKMIEFVSTPTHVQLIIEALRYRVVELIQDLNGNHVIQKCLNKLSPEDAQFIFSAVGNNCIEVGTHRHGCCVLQRCIDHASGEQKMWLVTKITENATRLVQDPFGNYVVQYIIDLNESVFTEPLIQQFRGKISQLSRHKFSSNVMEKCIRCGNDDSKDMMVNELLAPGEMERLLRDSFGNYVVQTALDHCTYPMKIPLVEAIRPIVPTVRNTPYGRRLQAKIQQHDTRSANTSGQATPADATQGQIAIRPPHTRAMTTQSIVSPPGPYTNGHSPNGINGTRGRMAYPPPNGMGVPGVPGNAPPQPPRMAQYPTYPGAGVNPGSGEGDFF
ncbi:ARM repeat-containing protein [Daldinia loculata]|uniref:ARM repeat-containing protein n=1 Tax=Daldinia loculata TaxID=103429 RepID=UPI0020C3231C|nr:ARM repeat-containing protein [Daldinia loculata]KAI1649634.1 ARM repeat-containing protein [Daldinia loculata]